MSPRNELRLLLWPIAAGAFITNTADAQLSAWAIGSVPEVAIGTQPGQELGFAIDAARLPDGRIVVVDPIARALVLFTPDGRSARTIGRPGEGPAEFLDPLSIEVAGDSIFVVDPGNQRISVMGADGRVIDEVSLNVPFVLGEAGRFSNGGWVLRRQDRYGLGAGRSGWARDSVTYFTVDSRMGDPKAIATAAGIWAESYELFGTTRNMFAPFTPLSAAATWRRCAYVTSTDEPSVAVYTMDGILVARAAFDAVPREVTSDDREFYVDFVMSRAPAAERRSVEIELRRSLRFPTHLPVTQGILVDPLGYVWLQEYELNPGLYGESRVYRVLDPQLHDLGRIALPVPMRLFEVGEDHLLGHVRGTHDESIVQLHVLDRSRPGATPPVECGR